jgi:hypothetical protein
MTELEDADSRTSLEAVKGGGFQTGLSDGEIREYMDDANMEVTDRLKGRGLSDRRLAKIERELTRHFIKFLVDEERQVQSEDIGPVSFDYAGALSAEGLKATTHGQQAIEYDTSDSLGPDGGDFWSVTA